jgi:glucuronokinase
MPCASASATAPARAALAGNPSDGYGGATLAVALGNYAAEVEVTAGGPPGIHPPCRLIEATLSRFERMHDGRVGPVRIRWRTNVPREVGLGGSSAIVTAALRALCRLCGVVLGADALAETALAVEVEELGIAAGLQDRVAQSYGGLTFMDFSRGAATPYVALDPGLLPELFVAFRPDARAGSGGVHADLRQRFLAGDPAVVAGMSELAGLASEAHDALIDGDVEAFAGCLDGSFDVRRRMIPLDPRHVAMIDRARRAGAAANYTGSGGAIVGVWGRNPEAVRAALRGVGARCVRAQVAQPPLCRR